MICQCGIDHDTELNQPAAKHVDTGRLDYAVSVQGWRFVVADRGSLSHVADHASATRFTMADAESALARWIDGEKQLGWHVPGQAKIVNARH